MCRAALDLSTPHTNAEQRLLESTSGTEAGLSGLFGGRRKLNTPSNLRLLVAVTSACCTKVSLQRRATIRRTWAQLAKERYPDDVKIKFFLSQPPNSATLEEWLPAIQAEVQAYNDTVVLRGPDTYRNLPNKTFRCGAKTCWF